MQAAAWVELYVQVEPEQIDREGGGRAEWGVTVTIYRSLVVAAAWEILL